MLMGAEAAIRLGDISSRGWLPVDAMVRADEKDAFETEGYRDFLFGRRLMASRRMKSSKRDSSVGSNIIHLPSW